MGAMDLNIGYGIHLKMDSRKGPCQRSACVTIHKRMKSDDLNRKTAVVWRPISFFFPPIIFISWKLITLQYCSSFCHTLT